METHINPVSMLMFHNLLSVQVYLLKWIGGKCQCVSVPEHKRSFS